MNWHILAVGAPLLFVAYQSLSKLLPRDVSPFLVNGYISLIGAATMFSLYILTSSQRAFTLAPKYLPLTLAIGTLISLGNAAIIRAYSIGAPQTLFTGIFYPLLIVYGLLFGILFWGESLNWYQAIGVTAIFSGLLLMYFK